VRVLDYAVQRFADLRSSLIFSIQQTTLTHRLMTLIFEAVLRIRIRTFLVGSGYEVTKIDIFLPFFVQKKFVKKILWARIRT
jgi:hypothetical protein